MQPGNPAAFRAAVEPVVAQALDRAGLNPRMATAVVAQMALETGYGRSMPGNNMAGIKSHGRPGATQATTEYIGGRPVSVNDSFRTYGDWRESVADYVQFIIENPRYAQAGLLKAKTPTEFFDALQAAGYATDPAYAQKLAGTFSRLYQ